jgi:hypothetical protein
MMWQSRFIAVRIALLPQSASATALCSSFMVNAALWRSRQSMILKKPVPNLIRDGCRFSERIMREQHAKAKCRIQLKIISLERAAATCFLGRSRSAQRRTMFCRTFGPHINEI